ncbi:MAG: hypothetical protein Tsb0020_36000 [Haliangiales bacterium]
MTLALSTTLALALALALIAVTAPVTLAQAEPDRDGAALKKKLAAHPGLVDAGALIPELQVDLRYAGEDNFLGRSVYGDLDACFLQKDAAEMLARAQALLIKSRPDWRLRMLDCARPRWVQRAMWKLVVGTPQQSYVANPARGSIHNFGCAVDLTVATRAGEPLDMGTAYDFFGPAARPDRELALLARGELSAEQLANRLALREVMLRAGFRLLVSEWWHFDCASHRETRKRYRPIP